MSCILVCILHVRQSGSVIGAGYFLIPRPRGTAILFQIRQGNARRGKPRKGSRPAREHPRVVRMRASRQQSPRANDEGQQAAISAILWRSRREILACLRDDVRGLALIGLRRARADTSSTLTQRCTSLITGVTKVARSLRI